MIIEDIFKIKGEVDKQHYVVHKTITPDKHFKAVKTYKIDVYITHNNIEPIKKYSVQKITKLNDEVWNELEKELLKQIFNERRD